jgi:ankyrin repeat protein
LLISKQAKVNDCDKHGWSALHAAVASSNMLLVTELLNAGADPNVGNELLCTPLVTAAGDNNLGIVLKLLECGASINAPGTLKTTATMAAAQHPNGKLLNALLERNPDLTLKDNRGLTALDIAKREGAKRNVKALLAHDHGGT